MHSHSLSEEGRREARPRLVRQSTTEVQTAYREVGTKVVTRSTVMHVRCLLFPRQQALARVEELEVKLEAEHCLRGNAESFLAEIQLARGKAMSCVESVKGSQTDVRTHADAIRFGGWGRGMLQISCTSSLFPEAPPQSFLPSWQHCAHLHKPHPPLSYGGCCLTF